MSEPTKAENAISDQEVAKLLPALAEAERATEETAARFVPPRPGILEEVSARRHQLVYGRRGVGKSTLLRRVRAEGPENDRAVIFVDVETLRGRPYPDVLIELLKELLDHLEERLRADGRYRAWRRRKLCQRVRELSDAMAQLLQEPQLAQHTVSILRSQARASKRGWSLGGTGRLGRRGRYASGELGASADAVSSREKQETEQATVAATFEKTKMDGLVEAAVLVRDVLAAAQEELAVPTLVVLDDIYHTPMDDQAEVLAYLHQVVKGLDISLKICGVKRLLRPYASGDPPIGMQPEHDAGTISLDITLERFDVAKQFLERVLDGICAPLRDRSRPSSHGRRTRTARSSVGRGRTRLHLARPPCVAQLDRACGAPVPAEEPNHV